MGREATAQMADRPATPPKPLQAGDPAPVLDAAKWFKGTEVKGFEKGKAYVVEFWATWCMPCRASIPKLTATQKKYGEKGFTVIGVSVDQGGADAIKKVQDFVDRMGDKMSYSIMLDGGQTGAGYLAGAGVQGIPHAFVVDKDGKMVWHGNPNQVAEGMELVIAEVAEGKFDVKKHAERQARFAELDGKYAAAQQGAKWEEAEKLLVEIEQLRPDLTAVLAATKYGVVVSSKDVPRAIAMAKKFSEGEFKNEAEALMSVADRVAATPDLSPADREFSLGLARHVVDLTKAQSAGPLSVLAMAQKNAGQFDEAIATMQKAVDVASEEMEKRYYGDRLNEFKAAKAAAAVKPDVPKPDAAKAEPASDAKPTTPGKP
jgi:thiol-disulfide isomerase/thioredoxin